MELYPQSLCKSYISAGVHFDQSLLRPEVPEVGRRAVDPTGTQDHTSKGTFLASKQTFKQGLYILQLPAE